MYGDLESLNKEQVGKTLSWSEVWTSVITQPSVETFERILQDPTANANRAYRWVFLSSLVGGTFGTLVASITPGAGSMYPEFTLLGVVCLPATAAIAVLGFALGVGLTQLIAGKLLGGAGSYEKLAYAFGANTAPLGLITSVLGAIPSVGLFSFIASLYGLVLSIMAVKTVNHFTWGKAIAPMLIIVIVVGLLVARPLAILGPAINDVYQDILRELGTPMP
jgi:hypothetical protein